MRNCLIESKETFCRETLKITEIDRVTISRRIEMLLSGVLRRHPLPRRLVDTASPGLVAHGWQGMLLRKFLLLIYPR